MTSGAMTPSELARRLAARPSCNASLPEWSHGVQAWHCDLRVGHTGDHASIAANCNAPRGYQVVKRWAS